ncbi:MAG: type II toxin-antitoxin system VapC family toxin [Leptospirales bacterium]|nr:type II toxin-antitoxin system VapC family toxin [Leptospirales bacterium]
MTYVYDASFIGSIIIPDEKNIRTEKAYASVGEDESIFVPQLFWYEISNLFKNLLRRKRYRMDDIVEFYQSLAAIRLINDNESGIGYSKKLLYFCNDYDLSSYDASYLELAERKNATLCTFDEYLITAAKKSGVRVLN